MDKADLLTQVVAMRAVNSARIQHFSWEGRAYWLKQIEKPRPGVVDGVGRLLILLTRNPLYAPATVSGAEALQAEIRRLQKVADKGMPVGRVVLSDRDWFVVPDLGLSIRQIMDDPETDDGYRQAALKAAAESLAGMHASNIWHGKPTLRDMVWDGQQIWYVDFEEDPAAYFSAAQCKVRDLMFFVYSLFRYLQPGDPLLEALVLAYRERAPAEIWPGACRLARRMPIVYGVCTALDWLGIRDLRQVRQMLRLFRRQD